ncbi:MAG: Zn-dependent protease, partial [Pseudomonadota bacterium]
MQFKGTAFPPKSSERHQAILNVAQANSLSLVVADDIFSCDQQ